MREFAAWVQGPWGTGVICVCALLAGLVLGVAFGLGRGRDQGYDACIEDNARADAMARRVHPGYRRRPVEVAHEWEPAHVASALTVANELPENELLHEWHDHPPLKYGDEGVAGCPSCEARWECPPPANGDPITTGEIRAITEDMNVFMGRLLGEHPAPYPDGSGQ